MVLRFGSCFVERDYLPGLLETVFAIMAVSLSLALIVRVCVRVTVLYSLLQRVDKSLHGWGVGCVCVCDL